MRQLQVLCQSFPENHPIKKKILLQLSDIALDKGIREVHAKRNIEAKAFFLLAYVSALGDRPHDTQAQAEALSLWMGKDTMSILAVLMQELQSNKVKLLEFQTAYQAQCKVLGLTPTDVLSYPVTPLPASSTASSAVSPAAKFTDVKDRKDSKDGKAAAAGVLSQFEQHKQKTSPTNGRGPSSSHASDASGVTVPNVNATSGPTGPNPSAIQGLDEEDENSFLMLLTRHKKLKAPRSFKPLSHLVLGYHPINQIDKYQQENLMAAESKNILDDIAFKKILEDITQGKITELRIWGKKINVEQIQTLAQALKKNTSVTTIDLDNTNLGPEGQNILQTR